MQTIFKKKCFLFKMRSACRVKGFTTASRNSLKVVRKSQMMPKQVRKWADFEALVEGWDKCTNVDGGYV
jgi:hypothetical protein